MPHEVVLYYLHLSSKHKISEHILLCKQYHGLNNIEETYYFSRKNRVTRRNIQENQSFLYANQGFHGRKLYDGIFYTCTWAGFFAHLRNVGVETPKSSEAFRAESSLAAHLARVAS